MGSPHSGDEDGDVHVDDGQEFLSSEHGYRRALYITNTMHGPLFYRQGSRPGELNNLAKATQVASDGIRILRSRHGYLII